MIGEYLRIQRNDCLMWRGMPELAHCNAMRMEMSNDPADAVTWILESAGIDLMCDHLKAGETYAKIAHRYGVGVSTLGDFLARPEFSGAVLAAREIRADTLFDSLLDISDDGERDTYIDENGNVRVNHDIVQRSKLRVETRKWMAQKLNPGKYGDKIAVDQTVTISPLQEAFQRLAAQGSALPISTARTLQGAPRHGLPELPIPITSPGQCATCANSGIPGGCPECGTLLV